MTNANPEHERPIGPRLSAESTAALREVAIATLAARLHKRGVATTFLRGLRPTRPDLRLVGYAYTLRYLPLREDIAAAEDPEWGLQRRAVETIAQDEVLVIDARGEPGAGTLGDMLARRALRRGAAGIVTDGGLRDTDAIARLGIPTYYQAPHAALLGVLHHPIELDVAVACGGVLVMPGDVLVGDAEGVLLLPFALAGEIALEAVEHERREAFAIDRIDAGESLHGLFPLSDERRTEYEAWRAARGATGVN